LVIWIALVIFKPFKWREWVAGIVGYATIFFFLAVYYYLTNRLNQFYDIWLPLGAKFPNRININYYNYIVLVPVLLILMLCFIKLRQNFFKSYVQVRKSFQLLFFVFLIAYYFLYASNKWIYETLYFLLLLSIIYFQFNTF
jgi:uncharacterized membrane protein